MMIKRTLTAMSLLAFAGAVSAKLPPPDEAAKAKAAETTARAAWQAKVAGYQLCKAQDRIAAKFKGSGGAQPTQVAARSASAPAAPAAAASAPAAGASAPTTPVASAPPAPCIDPGPFAYNPPSQKPLETSGAHSPTGTSGGAPSVRPEHAEMAPAKPSTAPAGGASAAK